MKLLTIPFFLLDRLVDFVRHVPWSFTMNTRAWIFICLFSTAGALAVGVWFGQGMPDWQLSFEARQNLVDMQASLDGDRKILADLQGQSRSELQALTVRLAELQARMVRLEALGEHMAQAAQLDNGEFDFSQPPAIGGPETDVIADVGKWAVLSALDNLSVSLQERSRQLGILETLLTTRKFDGERTVAGKPVRIGALASSFGVRRDPFTGRLARHAGLDFTGPLGSDILSVASGVVTWSSYKDGYGRMVEINHGDGFSTRYAHNSQNLVKVGDTVKKGQIIALMGSSGRSTGSHVHFEVLKGGNQVNPLAYIRRQSTSIN
jgi:murein DD-endopeptidase MepM/ murein hydrolase activator NlpD